MRVFKIYVFKSKNWTCWTLFLSIHAFLNFLTVLSLMGSCSLSEKYFTAVELPQWKAYRPISGKKIDQNSVIILITGTLVYAFWAKKTPTVNTKCMFKKIKSSSGLVNFICTILLQVFESVICIMFTKKCIGNLVCHGLILIENMSHRFWANLRRRVSAFWRQHLLLQPRPQLQLCYWQRTPRANVSPSIWSTPENVFFYNFIFKKSFSTSK